MYLYNAATPTLNSSAVSVKLAEMQFRVFLNMPLLSCKFKYNKRNKFIV